MEGDGSGGGVVVIWSWLYADGVVVIGSVCVAVVVW